MTDTDTSVEALAQRIADRGQDALVRRLRTVYDDAAAAHADLIALDAEQIEAMVQSAAGNADGLQWRRALAGVAADELGVSVNEALTHPAVRRAQALVGAPSYDQSVAELIAHPASPRAVQPVPATAGRLVTASPASADEPVTKPDPELANQLESVQADDVVLELLPEPDPTEYETAAYDVEASFAEEETAPTLEPEALTPAVEEEMVIPAIHLGGVANLPTKREGLGVRLSADGLDIMEGELDIIGRLIWDEIEALEVPNPRTRRRRQEPHARLVVRTPHGDASFDIPGISTDELRDRVESLVRRFGRH